MKKDNEIDIQRVRKFFDEVMRIEDEDSKTADTIEDIMLVSILGRAGEKLLSTREIRRLWIEKLNELSDILRNKYFVD